ncbi:MAG: aldehyde dehydrogenase family protein, partial [Thermocrispum sp.]
MSVSTPTEQTEQLESRNPATGEVVGSYPVHGDDAVREAVDAARAAAAWWSGLGFDGRKQRLLAWKRQVVRRIDELATIMHAETGKPADDARLEAIGAIEHIDWAARHAAKVLGNRKVRTGPLAMNLAASVQYQPLGVVGVIGPWNYPILTPVGSIAYALAAGNAVVFKP